MLSFSTNFEPVLCSFVRSVVLPANRKAVSYNLTYFQGINEVAGSEELMKRLFLSGISNTM